MTDLGPSHLSSARPSSSRFDATGARSRLVSAMFGTSRFDVSDERSRSSIVARAGGSSFDIGDKRSKSSIVARGGASVFDVSDRRSKSPRTGLLNYLRLLPFQISPAGVDSAEAVPPAFVIGNMLTGPSPSTEAEPGVALTLGVSPIGVSSREEESPANVGGSSRLAGASSGEGVGSVDVATLLLGAGAGEPLASGTTSTVRATLAGASSGESAGGANVVPSFVLNIAGASSGEGVACSSAVLVIVAAGASSGEEQGPPLIAPVIRPAGLESGERGGTNTIAQFAGQFAGVAADAYAAPNVGPAGHFIGVASSEATGGIAVFALFPVPFYPGGVPVSQSVVELRGSSDGVSRAPASGPMPSRVPTSVVTSKAPRSR